MFPDTQEEFLNILENRKWPIHGSVKRKMILRNFKLHRKTSQSVLHSGTSDIILKVSKKNREKKKGTAWTEERRGKHKERVREIWRERKKEGNS